MWEFCAGWWIPRLFKAYQLKLIESFWHGKHTATWRMIDKITTNFISKSGGSAQAPLIINLSNNLLRFFKKSTTKLSHAIGQRSSETKLPINFNWKKSLGKATVRIELEFWWKFSQIVMREFWCGLNFEKTCWLFNYLREQLELTGKEPTHLFLLHSRAKYTRKKKVTVVLDVDSNYTPPCKLFFFSLWQIQLRFSPKPKNGFVITGVWPLQSKLGCCKMIKI